MPTPRKEATVKELSDLLRRANVTILTEYRGMKVSDLNDLRRQLRQSQAEYHITKNTLVKRAVEALGFAAPQDLLQGPTAMVFCFGDLNTPAKTILEYARGSKTFKIKGGMFQKRPLTAAEVQSLATLPPREYLIGQLLGSVQLPLASLIGAVESPMRSLIYVLQERSRQLSEAA